MKQEILNAVRENRLYDFIANNYYRMSKEDLKRVALEAIYLVKSSKLEELAENLDEYLEDDE